MSETTETIEAEAQPKTRQPKVLATYADREPTDLQARFSEWLLDKTGIMPADEDSFRAGVRLSTALRMEFQKSPENIAGTEAAREARKARELARSAGSEKTAEERKAKAEERAKKAEERAAAAKAKAAALLEKAEARAKALREKAEGTAAPKPAAKKAAAKKATAKTATKETDAKAPVADATEDDSDAPW